MTAARTNRLALVTDANDSDPMGDEAATEAALLECDPVAVSELEFRLRLSIRLIELEKQVEQHRRTLNRIILRFQLDGRPIPTGAA